MGCPLQFCTQGACLTPLTPILALLLPPPPPSFPPPGRREREKAHDLKHESECRRPLCRPSITIFLGVDGAPTCEIGIGVSVSQTRNWRLREAKQCPYPAPHSPKDRLSLRPGHLPSRLWSSLPLSTLTWAGPSEGPLEGGLSEERGGEKGESSRIEEG